MKKIKLFLASSAKLKADRAQFEIFIYRKCKAWINKGIFLHLDIWEDYLDAMSAWLQDRMLVVRFQWASLVLMEKTRKIILSLLLALLPGVCPDQVIIVLLGSIHSITAGLVLFPKEKGHLLFKSQTKNYFYTR